MTDLDQRIAALREDHNDPSAWSRGAMSIIDEQAAEIERLRARVAELEAPKGLAAFVRASPEERERIGNEVAKAAIEEQEKTLRDAGPTPLRGRVTRRDE